MQESTLNIVKVIKSRRLKWAGHIARMEEVRSTFKILIGNRYLARPKRTWEHKNRIHLNPF